MGELSAPRRDGGGSVPVLVRYRLARAAGFSFLGCLAFSLFGRRPPEIQRLLDESQARLEEAVARKAKSPVREETDREGFDQSVQTTTGAALTNRTARKHIQAVLSESLPTVHAYLDLA